MNVVIIVPHDGVEMGNGKNFMETSAETFKPPHEGKNADNGNRGSFLRFVACRGVQALRLSISKVLKNAFH